MGKKGPTNVAGGDTRHSATRKSQSTTPNRGGGESAIFSFCCAACFEASGGQNRGDGESRVEKGVSVEFFRRTECPLTLRRSRGREPRGSTL